MPIRSATDPETIDAIVTMREQGEIRKVIADELDVSGQLVSACTAHLPEEMPKRERDRLAILRGMAEGLDVSTIATEAKVPVSRVVRLIRSQRMAEAAREAVKRRDRSR